MRDLSVEILGRSFDSCELFKMKRDSLASRMTQRMTGRSSKSKKRDKIV